MSGIVGIVSGDGSPIDGELLQSLTRGLAWRGPEAQRHWVGNGVGLGNALLATTRESIGEVQPRSYQDELWITADARIDARGELVDRLRSKFPGVSASGPDSELILLAYRAWDDECLQHLIGDFAFAIWDVARRRIFCARDQFGVTPFYYCRLGKDLFFSNALRCLRSIKGVSVELNELAIADFLLTGCNQELDTTWFRDIQMLPPGHSLSFEANELRTQRYWTVPEPKEPLRYSRPEEYAEHFRDLLEVAVTDRLRMDEVYSTMSGGLDSTSITALAHGAYREGRSTTKVTAYSIGFDWLIPDDEREYAALVAEKCGVSTHYLAAERFLIPDAPEGTWKVFPEPRFSGRPAPAWEVLEIATKAGTRVALDGYGGDPLFELRSDHWERLLDGHRYGTLLADSKAYRNAYGRRPPFRLKERLSGERGRRRRAVQASIPSASFKRFNVDFAQRVDIQGRIVELNRRFKEPDPRMGMALMAGWSNMISSTDPEITSLPVKVRHPFFDVRLVKFMVQVPPVPWLLDKNLLREAMRDILPEPVRTRKKTPLKGNFMAELIFRGHERQALEFLSAPELGEYINSPYVLDYWQNLKSASAGSCEKFVYYPATLGLWLSRLSKAM